MCHPKIKSVEYFNSLDAFNKGYAVYMYGARDDEPFVPRSFEPNKEDQEEYSKGGDLAVIHVTDIEG